VQARGIFEWRAPGEARGRLASWFSGRGVYRSQHDRARTSQKARLQQCHKQLAQPPRRAWRRFNRAARRSQKMDRRESRRKSQKDKAHHEIADNRVPQQDMSAREVESRSRNNQQGKSYTKSGASPKRTRLRISLGRLHELGLAILTTAFADGKTTRDLNGRDGNAVAAKMAIAANVRPLLSAMTIATRRPWYRSSERSPRDFETP